MKKKGAREMSEDDGKKNGKQEKKGRGGRREELPFRSHRPPRSLLFHSLQAFICLRSINALLFVSLSLVDLSPVEREIGLC